MQIVRLSALAAALAAGAVPAWAQGLPFGVAAVGQRSATAITIQCPDGSTSCFSGGSSTTTPYLQGAATTSATTGTYTQALAADSGRTACSITNTGTGQQSVIQSATTPSAGTASPYPTMAPNGNYSCGGYKGAVWIASTVASDPYAYEGDR